jgi:hypothetical protein
MKLLIHFLNTSGDKELFTYWGHPLIFGQLELLENSFHLYQASNVLWLWLCFIIHSLLTLIRPVRASTLSAQRSENCLNTGVLLIQISSPRPQNVHWPSLFTRQP